MQFIHNVACVTVSRPVQLSAAASAKIIAELTNGTAVSVTLFADNFTVFDSLAEHRTPVDCSKDTQVGLNLHGVRSVTWASTDRGVNITLLQEDDGHMRHETFAFIYG